MIVVFDSGIWISAMQYDGTPLAALNHCIAFGEIGYCDRIESEILGILYRKFGIHPQEVSDRLQPLLENAFRIEIAGEVSGVCRDPADDCILECAVGSGAQFIVTGDNDLLVLREFRGIRILTARQHLDLPA